MAGTAACERKQARYIEEAREQKPEGSKKRKEALPKFTSAAEYEDYMRRMGV
jgi:hypothetical protein